MKNFLEKNRSFIKILATFVIFAGIIWAYVYFSTFYIIVRFNELGPLAKNMAAYYNGFKIGKIVNIGPDKDFKHTLVRVNFNVKEINLPQNATVHVESFPNGELYLQFKYPDSPSFRIIKSGDTIEGIAPYSIEQFMLGQNISGVSDIVSLHVIRALNATEVANQEMTAFFQNTSKLINENSKGINASVNNTAAMTKSLAQMAENLNQASKKINNALDEETLKSATVGIKDASINVSKATKDMDKTVKKIDAAITQVNETAENLNSITRGLHETLGRRFAGMRIMFGTPIKQKNEVRNACN